MVVNEQCCPSLLAAPLDEAEADELAGVFAALADPVRLRLLSMIAERRDLCLRPPGPLGKSQPTVSHHTKVLAEAGLITGEKRAGGSTGRSCPSGWPRCAPLWAED